MKAAPRELLLPLEPTGTWGRWSWALQGLLLPPVCLPSPAAGLGWKIKPPRHNCCKDQQNNYGSEWKTGMERLWSVCRKEESKKAGAVSRAARSPLRPTGSDGAALGGATRCRAPVLGFMISSDHKPRGQTLSGEGGVQLQQGSDAVTTQLHPGTELQAQTFAPRLPCVQS